MSRLLDAAGDARFVFVVGKGGVGKTTAAGALALAGADAGTPIHLLSTDPAHSLVDLFGSLDTPCDVALRVEELDAATRGREWLARAMGPVSSIVESGTYLDAEDVGAFSRLALPGVDELMAMLRLVELADGDARVLVDTAPTGHTLRLLDAARTFASLAAALRAMAEKGAAVAQALLHANVTLEGAAIIDEIEEQVRRYRADVLERAAFIVAARPGHVVEAETERLVDALEQRRLRVAAVVWSHGVGTLRTHVRQWRAPLLDDARGCDALRTWHRDTALVAGAPSQLETGGVAERAPEALSFARWLSADGPPLLLFAGKGGVGKSTCAAAAAVVLAETRDVLLCSADPAGSLAEVLPDGAPRVRTLQIDPAAELGRLRDAYRADVAAALDRIGLTESAALDRRVIEQLWELSPPGIDELAALSAMLSVAEEGATVVLDTAPTGHLLRLIETPDTALAWTRQLMRIVVKYGIAGVAADAAQSLLDLARDLKALAERLRDPQRTGAVVVTLPEPLVRAETERLAGALAQAGVSVLATLTNRAREDVPGIAGMRVAAPELANVEGSAALREFAEAWKIVP